MSIHTNFIELSESDLKSINELNESMEDMYDVLLIILVLACVVLLISLVAFGYFVFKNRETDDKLDNLLQYDHLRSDTV